MGRTTWLASVAGISLLASILSQGVAADTVTVQDVIGNPGDSFTVSLFVDEVTLTSVPGGFDLQATLDFDPNLTLTTVAAATAAPVSTAAVFWPLHLAAKVVGVNAFFNADPGTLQNAEMLRLTFTIGAGAGAGPFPIRVSTFDFGATAASTIVPLPSALWLFGATLAALSVFRRRS